MASNWGIIGHHRITNYLDYCLENQRLAQTYLFYGLEHLGKTTVALKLAERLLGSDIAKESALFELQLEADKKEISVEQVRQWQRQLSLKSFQGGYKVGIIHQIEKLNQRSANALLKTIEEPAPKTLLILITNSSEQLLATIISRSQRIHFLPVNRADLIKFLAEKITDQAKLKKILSLTLGRPGLALELSQNEEKLQERLTLLAKLAKLPELSLNERFKLVEDWLKGDDLLSKTSGAQEFLGYYEIWLRENLLNEVYQASSQPGKIAKWVAQLNLTSRLKSLLRSNIQPQLALENLLINL